MRTYKVIHTTFLEKAKFFTINGTINRRNHLIAVCKEKMSLIVSISELFKNKPRINHSHADPSPSQSI